MQPTKPNALSIGGHRRGEEMPVKLIRTRIDYGVFGTVGLCDVAALTSLFLECHTLLAHHPSTVPTSFPRGFEPPPSSLSTYTIFVLHQILRHDV